VPTSGKPVRLSATPVAAQNPRNRRCGLSGAGVCPARTPWAASESHSPVS
jgi:hypothetical protein